MFTWNLKFLFTCTLLQMSSAEWSDDGKNLFFGLPVPPRTSKSDSATPLHTLLKSTFLPSDSNEGENTDLSEEIAPEEKVADAAPATSAPPSEKGFLTTSLESVAVEFPGEDPVVLVPSFLQTEETASNARRQPPNGVTLASFIRSAVALARPLSSQRPATIQNLFSKSNRDLLRDMVSLAEGVLGRMGSTITKQNPVDFLNIIDNMQNAVDRLGGEGECTPIVELMDQTVITLKEVIETMNAVQKLGEMWSTVNISALRKCIAKPGGISAAATRGSEKTENVRSP